MKQKIWWGIFSTIATIFLSISCTEQQIEPAPVFTETPAPSNTLQLTNTPQPTQTATVVATSTPDPCIRNPAPPEVVIPQGEQDNNRLIAFSVEENDNLDIYVMDLNGGNRRNITNHVGADDSPEWSPDGKRIAFVSNRNGPVQYSCNGPASDCVYELYVMRPDGSGLLRLSKGITYSPVWSPDGKQLAFVHYFVEATPSPSDSSSEETFLSDVYIVNADGSNLRRLTDTSDIYFNPVWSPDGKKLVFGSPQIKTGKESSIMIADVNGAGLQHYSDFASYELFWTPDSNHLLFIASDNNEYDIYKLKIDFASIENLSNSPNTFKSIMSVSPNGKWIAYTSSFTSSDTQNYCNQIRVINTETLQDYFVYDIRDVETIPGNGNVPPSPSSLGITGISWSPNSRELIFSQMIRHGDIVNEFQELFAINLDGTGLKQIGDGEIWSPAIQP